MGSNPKTLRSSVADGIAITPRYRERQLSALHKALSAARNGILSDLRDNSTFSQNEAIAEYLLTLNAVKSFHSACDPVHCHEEEYSVAKLKDYSTRRTPYGYAYITPADSSSLYSTIVPVAAAIAAGNVVLLQRPTNSSAFTVKIEDILTQVLSAETFAFVDRDPMDPRYQRARGVIFEGKSSSNATTTSRRICSPVSRVVALVDRSGDLKLAADDLVRARFGFGGTSTYAPDFVFVNEFKTKEFCEAVAEAGLRYLSQDVNGSTNGSESKRVSKPDINGSIAKSGNVLISGNRGQVVLLPSQDTEILAQKINTPILLIVPVSSMDNAIDLLNSSDTPLLASYVYATPAAGKYITQFVQSAASFINHIPAELLIGGAAPSGFPTSTHPRYSPEMFSAPSPILINRSSNSKAIASLVALADSKQTKQLEKEFDTNLALFKEPFGPAIGFFEQGFLFNASVILSGVAVGTFCGVRYGYPALMAAIQG